MAANTVLTNKINLVGAWCGIYYCIFLLVGWWIIGGFLPLHEPSAGAEEIAAFFRDNTQRIRAGMIVVMWGAAIFLGFASTVAYYISRIEGKVGPLTFLTLLAGFSNSMLSFYPPLWWLINSFRPEERSVELIYLLNDAAWLQFIGGISLFMPMLLTVAIAALCDTSKRPIFPRWSGYVSIWLFVLFLPGQLLFFFKDGPFAWNGVFGFWIVLGAFCGWFVIVFSLIRKQVLYEIRCADDIEIV